MMEPQVIFGVYLLHCELCKILLMSRVSFIKGERVDHRYQS